MKEYSMCYSKTDEDTILEDHHFINGVFPWNCLETKKTIVDLLNDKEKQINDLEMENRMLKWYFEELRVHVSKDKLEEIDRLYEQLEKKESIR